MFFRFFNFASSTSSENENQNNPVDDVTKRKNNDVTKRSRDCVLNPGTIAEALKQLQLIEEREEEERKLSNPDSTDDNDPENTPTRLNRFFEISTKNNNENRRKLSLSKNVRKLTLTTNLSITSDDNDSAIENEVFDKKCNILPTEMSAKLLSICAEKESLVGDILRMICELRDTQLVEMSYRVRQRALAAKFSSYVMRDFPSLYGRCFNLSMNMKILFQCQYADSSIAARVLSDFDILEKSLAAKLQKSELKNTQSDLTSMLHQIKI